MKQAKAQKLLASLVGVQPGTILLWQVAWEVLSILRKWENQGRVSAANVVANFRDVTAMFPLSIPGPQLFLRYFDLQARFSLPHWDSMLLAACKEAGVTTLYSEDMGAGTDYDGLIVVNPFA